MKRSTLLALSLALSAPAVYAADPAPTPTTLPAQSADEMLAAIDAIKPPVVDPTRRQDPAYARQHMEQLQAAANQQFELRLAFIKTYPTHEQTDAVVTSLLANANRLRKPIDPLLADLRSLPLSKQALADVEITGVQAGLMSAKPDLDAAYAKYEAIRQETPDAKNLPNLAFMIAQASQADARADRLRQVIADYPDSPVASRASGLLRRTEGVGKPFELTFNDAVTGNAIDVQKDLKGKVIVIDFWATWCGPCIADMPKMKSLYAKYKDQGVEFIGISLDQPEDKGGKQKLLDYVAANDIAWPQYYQGNYWQSAFSSGWGINSIPALFVVDANGNLANVNARAKLEEVILEHLPKTDAK